MIGMIEDKNIFNKDVLALLYFLYFIGLTSFLIIGNNKSKIKASWSELNKDPSTCIS
ncbi:unnamed protein product [Meloidogyne enterolobii]|uniref:Uncharacterized protein n=1 Tax=Meloidogyne enterolobii TaxID=390850 RepID=A0ACB0ZKL6_MELEN